eukprot:145764-Pyramimonas_sp.AAC.1
MVLSQYLTVPSSEYAPLRLIVHLPLLLPALPYLDIGTAVYRSYILAVRVRKERAAARPRPGVGRPASSLPILEHSCLTDSR